MIIEQLQKDLEVLNAKKEQAFTAYHQILGAVDIIHQLIQRETEAETYKSNSELYPSQESIELPTMDQVPELNSDFTIIDERLQNCMEGTSTHSPIAYGIGCGSPINC